VWRIAVALLIDAIRFVSLGFRSRSQLAAENLFLRKQLALYRERRVKSRRADDATRITLVVLSQLGISCRGVRSSEDEGVSDQSPADDE